MAPVSSTSPLKSALTVILTLPAIALGWALANSQTPSQATTSSIATVIPIRSLEMPLGSRVLRRESPKAAIVEFSDFECPFCGRYAREVYPAIKTRFVDTGLIAYAFKHLPLERIHPTALRASQASECAGRQGKFWRMHDELFRHQTDLSLLRMHSLAGAVGLEPQAFASCLGGDTLKTIREDQIEAQRLGVTGTPVFFIGKLASEETLQVTSQIRGAQDLETFARAIDATLEQE